MSDFDPSYNPFEPEETPDQQMRRVGRIIRENVDARIAKERMPVNVPPNFGPPNRLRMTPVLAREFVDLVKVLLDQIADDPRACQFFDTRLIQRAKDAVKRAEDEGRDEL